MTHHENICITSFDYARLKNLVGSYAAGGQVKHNGTIARLAHELARAEKVEPEKIPADTVTMNSTFTLKDLDESNETRIVTLVFPDDADFELGKMSITSPVGVAVLGYRAGDIVRWDVPAGEKTFQIEEIIYQPEAVGDFHL